MNIAKKYYVDKDDNMIGYTRYCRDKTEIPAEQFQAKLRIIDMGWLNSGCFFKLQDENSKTYNMNDLMLKKYIAQNDLYLEGEWNFYQQGTAFSIGL